MKAVYLLGTLCCVASLVAGQTIAITGTSTLVTPTSELRIMCQPSTAGIDDINSISVRKNTSTADYTTLVSVSYSKATSTSVIKWSNAVFENRVGVSATGNVNTVSGARLELTISQNNTRCEDGGAYQCLMGVTMTGGSAGLADDEKYVTATVQPTYTNALFVSPPPNVDGQYYSVGTMLTFSCSGSVGSDKKIHTWCYRQTGSVTNTGFTGYPNAADIDQNENGLVRDGCNWRRSSTLTYNVTAADTRTTFMCEPYTGSFCGSSAAGLKANSTFTVYSTGGSTGGQSGSGGSSGETSSAGTIAGAVIGAFAGILLIILIVYFVVFRRRSGGETYNTKEDGSPENAENGGPAHTEGPVYSVPDKNRSRGASPPGRPPSPPRESESLVEAKRELHYADLDIACRPPGVPAPRLSKHTPTEYSTVKFV